MFIALQSIPVIEQFARGGGGGSSGGDGGGGEVIALIGYGIGYALCKPIKKYAPKQLAMPLSIVVTVVASILIVSFLFIGSLAASAIAWYIEVLIILGLWTAWYTVMYGTWGKLTKRFKNADIKIAAAAQNDAAWSEASLHELAQNTFVRFQNDWTMLDTANLSTYMAPSFAEKTYLQMRILHELGRQNAVMEPRIINMDVADIHDDADNSNDTFTVAIQAQAKDMLIDSATRQTIFEDNSEFIEYWRFRRTNTTWLLEDIEQHTQNLSAQNLQVRAFAEANSMHFSLDMGWLFMPARGQVFKGGAFGVSDINNHVVGVVGDLLVQLYTYVPTRGENVVPVVIGQIALPKWYGNILVRPKKAMGGFFAIGGAPVVKPFDGATKYEYEWPDFNRKFEVFASDADRLASFELINPKFMEMMYAIDEKLVLEVVDNVVYFRVGSGTSVTIYEQLFSLLRQAHKELKR